MAYLFYYALLGVWPLLLWPALRLTGRDRAWLCFVALAGLAATLHEVRVVTGPPSAIRLDIPLIAIALGVLYGITALQLARRRWRKSAAALGAVLLLGGGGLATVWIEAGREGARLTEIFHARNALLFEAKFRDLDSYGATFGTFDARPTGFPVGHWEAQEGGYFSRLIVNPEGQAWAFFPCGETECPYRSAESGLRAAGDAAEGRWQVTLKPPVGLPVEVRIAQPDPAHLTLEGQGAPTSFTKTPPPIDPAPARRQLVYLGPFLEVACRGQHADVRQFWLWQEDQRLYGVAVVATLVAGMHAGFVSPIVLGEGVRQGDAWTFTWQRNEQTWTASLVLEGPDARLTLVRDGTPAGAALLARDALFRDEAIELAPLTSKADWDHWFDIVLVGHFTSGEVPACTLNN